MKKIFALVLVSCLTLGMLAGCGDAAGSTSSATSESATISASEVQIPAENAVKPSESVAEAETSALDAAPEVESIYPLTDETVTLTYWGPDLSSNNTALPTYSNLEAYDFWPFVEKSTGVKLKMTIVSMASESEQLNLVLASGDYMDIMAINESQVSGGMTSLLNQDIATDIAGIVEEYMPNYYDYISADEDTLKLCYNDDGQMAGTRSWAEYYVPNQGLVVRQDIMEDLGIEAPNTIDELHDLLTAFKDYGMDAALWLGSSGQNSVSIVGALGSCGYASDRGSTTDHLYVENGQVVSSLTSDTYRDYLELMNQWYSEGLINADFATNTDMEASSSSMLNGETGVMNAMYGQALSLQTSLNVDNPDAQLMALATPVKEEGDVNPFVNDSPLSNTSWRVITTACKDVELAARYIDWWYTEDGYLTANYGTYGLSYELDENGEPYYADAVVNNSFGIDASSAVEAYVTTNPIFGLVSMDRTVYLAGEQWVDDMMTIWVEQTSSDQVLPTGVSLTSEETEEVTTALSDITTAASTYTLQFILGDVDFGQWNSYCAEIEAMGLAGVVSVYQNAYERSNAR